MLCFETSSPSYLLMSGVEDCLTYLEDHSFTEYIDRLDTFYTNAKQLQKLRLLFDPDDDNRCNIDAYDCGKLVVTAYGTELFVHKKSKSDEASSREVLQKLLPMLEELAVWDNEGLLAAMTKLAEEMGVKNAKVMWPVRIAAAGKAVTPGGATEIASILGREETLRRIRIALEKLG